MEKPINIGITSTEASYENYPIWIKGNDANINIIKLNQDNIADLDLCSALVLSGGIDTYPKLYHNPRMQYPNGPNEFNIVRDHLEMELLKRSQEKNMPLLAICRGMQLVNVYYGGNLLQDLEESNKSNHRKMNGIDGTHPIKIEKNSFIYAICQTDTGIINSAHHQGLDKIPANLRVTGWSDDGVAEVLEKKDNKNSAFFLAVQWHPERLAKEDALNPFTKNIRLRFIEAAKNYISCK